MSKLKEINDKLKGRVQQLLDTLAANVFVDHYGQPCKIIGYEREEVGSALYIGEPLYYAHKFKLTNGDTVTITVTTDKYVDSQK